MSFTRPARSASFQSESQIPSMKSGKSHPSDLSPAERQSLVGVLKARFDKNPQRHTGITWTMVVSRLDAHPEKLRPLSEMERSGGEPDVVAHDRKTGAVVFFDCSAETPKARTSVCYDRAGLESRKEHKPADTAMDMAAAIGIRLLTEDEYLLLQSLGEFDTKTSSWILAPADIRVRGGALYGERRYGRVFIGHNGAQSYYSARGFRGCLEV